MPIPRAREAPRFISASCSGDDAIRSEPVVSKTSSSLNSSIEYFRNRIIVCEGLNCVTRPAA